MPIIKRKLWPHRRFMATCRWQRSRFSDAGDRHCSALALASSAHLLTGHSAGPIEAPELFRFSISSDTNKKAPGNPGLPFIGFGQPSTGAEGFPEPIPHADLLLARRVLTGMVNISLLFGKS